MGAVHVGATEGTKTLVTPCDQRLREFRFRRKSTQAGGTSDIALNRAVADFR